MDYLANVEIGQTPIELGTEPRYDASAISARCCRRSTRRRHRDMVFDKV